MSRTVLVVLIATCLVGARSARATVVLDLPLHSLGQRATLVVRGVVEQRHAAWETGRRAITTRVTVRVIETWRGVAPASGQVVVDQPGGEIERVGQHVEGAASFEPGEEVVLFLEPHRARASEYVLVSLAASKFSVHRSAGQAMAVRDLSGVTFATRDADGHVRPGAVDAPAAVALEELRSAVQSP